MTDEHLKRAADAIMTYDWVISNEFEPGDEPWAAAVAAERERCAEVAAAYVLRELYCGRSPQIGAKEIRQLILQPPAADHDDGERTDADAADEAGEADRLGNAHSG